MRVNITSPRREPAPRAGAFILRHFFASCVTCAVACALWTVLYFALFFWAIFFGGGLGSPVTYPIGLFAVGVGAMTACLTLFLPSTALAEWLVRRRGSSVLAQIPICVGMLVLLCLTIILIVSLTRDHPSSIRGLSSSFAALFLALLPPLAIYWCAVRSAPLILSLLQQVRSAFRK
jgi:hypothetical protein